ncbi:MAG: glycosyltransferase [Bdellovibrio sp. CG10_big_fil_rev_8_21_14_0_10_47_8]|nr:MAG: glycosyltransferase [Bdellovibrio sp. CG10_big_fil_rev_8_21_14_0_10_47_8]
MFQYAESLLEALREMQSNGHEVCVAYLSHNWEKKLLSYPFKNVQMKCGRWSLNLSNVLMALKIPGSFSRFLSHILSPVVWQLAKLDCDLWIFPAQDALSYQVKVPVVATVHDLMHRYESSFPEVSRLRRGNIRDHRFSQLTQWARTVLVDSEVGKMHVHESYGTELEKIQVLPYIAPGHIVNSQDLWNFDQKYPLPKKFIFYPAQFWAHKNHQRLISAAAALRSDYPDIHLVFTGMKNKAYSEVYAHAEKMGMLDHVTFQEYVPDQDLVGFYRRARAMMMPTFFGPTNIPPLEAFACGCPTAVSGIYGMPEQVGDAALLFDPNSESDIASTMKRLWSDDQLCHELSQRGLEKAQRWGLPAFAKKLQEILLKSPHSL